MIKLFKETFFYFKYQYEMWMAQKSINRYNKIIKKHEERFNNSLIKITQKRDRKIEPYKTYISNIEKNILKLNSKLKKLNNV